MTCAELVAKYCDAQVSGQAGICFDDVADVTLALVAQSEWLFPDGVETQIGSPMKRYDHALTRLRDRVDVTLECNLPPGLAGEMCRFIQAVHVHSGLLYAAQLAGIALPEPQNGNCCPMKEQHLGGRQS